MVNENVEILASGSIFDCICIYDFKSILDLAFIINRFSDFILYIDLYGTDPECRVSFSLYGNQMQHMKEENELKYKEFFSFLAYRKINDSILFEHSVFNLIFQFSGKTL